MGYKSVNILLVNRRVGKNWFITSMYNKNTWIIKSLIQGDNSSEKQNKTTSRIHPPMNLIKTFLK